jgi:hypothetical protein
MKDQSAAVLAINPSASRLASWVIVWTPIGELLFDWRPPAHTAAVFALLSRASLDFIRPRTPDRRAAHPPGREHPRRHRAPAIDG